MSCSSIQLSQSRLTNEKVGGVRQLNATEHFREKPPASRVT